MTPSLPEKGLRPCSWEAKPLSRGHTAAPGPQFGPADRAEPRDFPSPSAPRSPGFSIWRPMKAKDQEVSSQCLPCSQNSRECQEFTETETCSNWPTSCPEEAHLTGLEPPAGTAMEAGYVGFPGPATVGIRGTRLTLWATEASANLLRCCCCPSLRPQSREAQRHRPLAALLPHSHYLTQVLQDFGHPVIPGGFPASRSGEAPLPKPSLPCHQRALQRPSSARTPPGQAPSPHLGIQDHP